VSADQPDADMMGAPTSVALFIATGQDSHLEAAFAGGPVTIIENFAPFLFEGDGALERWAKAMRAHADPLSSLTHSFGPAFDFAADGQSVSFSLPTTWRGLARGVAFTETGGWSFVLARHSGAWRVRAYGWAVTGFAFD
jgi:hypothetical protein